MKPLTKQEIMKHTKGPWKVLPEEAGVGYIRIRGTTLGGKHKIANVHCESFHEHKEARANARLISACPELYEALKDISQMGQGDDLAEAVCRAQEALKLVESGQEGEDRGISSK